MEGGRHGLFGKDNWRISGHLNGDLFTAGQLNGGLSALEGGWVGFAKENLCLAQEDMKMGGIIPTMTPVTRWIVSLSRIMDGSWDNQIWQP